MSTNTECWSIGTESTKPHYRSHEEKTLDDQLGPLVLSAAVNALRVGVKTPPRLQDSGAGRGGAAGAVDISKRSCRASGRKRSPCCGSGLTVAPGASAPTSRSPPVNSSSVVCRNGFRSFRVSMPSILPKPAPAATAPARSAAANARG